MFIFCTSVGVACFKLFSFQRVTRKRNPGGEIEEEDFFLRRGDLEKKTDFHVVNRDDLKWGCRVNFR